MRSHKPRPPVGPLTPGQIEILDLAARAGEAGATVSEIWSSLSQRRTVARTTVLTLVVRLAKRGWLAKVARRGADRAARYRATADSQEATRRVAHDFAAEFFGGSPTELMRSLLGGETVTRAQLDDLRALLDDVRPSDGPTEKPEDQP